MIRALILIVVGVALSAAPATHPPAPLGGWNALACLPLDDEQRFIDAGGSPALGASSHARQCHVEGRYEQALIEWRKAIALRAGKAPYGMFDVVFIHAIAGVDYDKSGKVDQAKTEWRAALALHHPARPEDIVTVLPEKANADFERGRYRQSFEDYSRLGYGLNQATYSEEGSLSIFEHADALAQAGKFADAACLLQQALRKSPTLFAAHFLLADVSFAVGKRRQAIDQWEQTLATLQTDPPDAAPGFYPAHWASLEMLVKYR